MLKHRKDRSHPIVARQPPSGGCVLKPEGVSETNEGETQPPSGGCVLKPKKPDNTILDFDQPPSGGCVLKL